MTFTFSDIVLGVAVMDREHEQLEALFNEFERCFGDEGAADRAINLAVEALALGNAHFEHEEALMDATQYPGAAEHKFQHRNLRLQFTTLADDTIANIRRHDPVTIEHIDVLRHLLLEHISGPDRALAAHLTKADAA